MRFFRPVSIAVYAFVLAFPLHALERVWSCALAGDIIAGPAASDDRVLMVLSDRTLTCISDAGSYLWRKPLGGRPAPFIFVSSFGQIFAAANNTIVSFSADGAFLWGMRCPEYPAHRVLEGKDGRLFIPFRRKLICLSPQGAIKWTLDTGADITDDPELTGDGEILVFQGETVIRISPFGEIRERWTPEEPISALVPVSSGFIAGTRSGTLRAYDIRDNRQTGSQSATECVWTATTCQSPVTALSELDGTLIALYGDGSVHGYNKTDGTHLWSLSSIADAATGGIIHNEYGQFTLSTPGCISAVSPGGTLVWRHAIAEKNSIPVLSPTGLCYTSSSEWVLHAYQPEIRIKEEKKLLNKENYGILKGRSSGYGSSILSESGQNAVFFESVASDIASGSVGPKEIDYARHLREILTCATGADPDANATVGSERGRAASLLGQLGSSEYRDLLIRAAYGALDESAAIGLLYGIGATGTDSAGDSLAAIRTISANAGSSADAVQKAACDALYAIIRYSSGKTARDGASMVGLFLYEPYTENVRSYARTIFSTILQ